jgi:hypothetical protein
LKSDGKVKIREFLYFSKYKSRQVGFPFSYSRRLIFSVEDVYAGLKYIKLKDTRHSLGTDEEEEYKIFKYTPHYEIAKFTGDQSD